MTDDRSAAQRPPLDLRVDGVTAVLGGAGDEQYEIRPDVRIGMRDGRIASIEPMSVAPEPAVRTIDGTGHAAIPGMICTHDHVFQNLIKGIGDELEVWPIVEGVILATAEDVLPTVIATNAPLLADGVDGGDVLTGYSLPRVRIAE